jgi:hypothetical protein
MKEIFKVKDAESEQFKVAKEKLPFYNIVRECLCETMLCVYADKYQQKTKSTPPSGLKAEPKEKTSD